MSAARWAWAVLLDQSLDVRNIALVFLMAVLTTAVTEGLKPALYSSVISALALNFFFLPPLYTFAIGDPESVVAFVFFFVRRHRRQQSDRERAASGGRGTSACPNHRRPLSVQQEAGGHRHAGRRALGDRVPARLHAEGARGAASP